jgi:hypothetical protein
MKMIIGSFQQLGRRFIAAVLKVSAFIECQTKADPTRCIFSLYRASHAGHLGTTLAHPHP